MDIILTTCCKKKDTRKGLLSACKRYIDTRINIVIKIANNHKTPLFFLSGRFGLIHKDTKIPWYDQIIADTDIEKISSLMAYQLSAYEIINVIFYGYPQDTDGWKNYYTVLEKSCNRASVSLKIILLNQVLK